MPRRQQIEGALHRAFWHHIQARLMPDAIAWHTPNPERRDRRTGALLKAMGTMPGIPDIFALRNGRLCGLELKDSEKGRVSPEQLEMHSRLRAAGA